MQEAYEELVRRCPERVVSINNILTEAAWFYREDEPDLFYELQRHEAAFRWFFQTNFGWDLRLDGKCARVVKPRVWNPSLKGRTGLVGFKLRGRDEYLAFLLLIEFYEHLLGEQSLSSTDAENPTFSFGEYLEYVTRRLCELLPSEAAELDAEQVKKRILRPLMEKLEDYRFVRELPRESSETLAVESVLYEALPACCQYHAAALEHPLEAEDEEGLSDGQ